MSMSRFTGALTAALMLAAPLAVHADARIDRMRIDPHGRVSGFILSDGTEYVTSPNTAAAVARNVQPGDMVHIDTGPGNTLTLMDVNSHRYVDLGGMDNLARGGGPTATFRTAIQYPRVDNAAELERLVMRGRITLITHTQAGTPTGFLLDNGAQVHLVPGVEGVFNDLRVGDTVHVDGRGTQTAQGDSIWALEISRPSGLVLFDMTRGIGAPELGMGR